MGVQWNTCIISIRCNTKKTAKNTFISYDVIASFNVCTESIGTHIYRIQTMEIVMDKAGDVPISLSSVLHHSFHYLIIKINATDTAQAANH
jgi:hypothetical protein